VRKPHNVFTVVAHMAIESFEFDAAKSAAFATFREELYRGDRNWIAASRAEFLGQFAPQFSFYRRADNRHRHFIAAANGKIAGHVSAFVSGKVKDHEGLPVGSLGFFECVDDYAIAEELLEQAIAWLRNENGLRRIWAPVNFDIWHGYRLMTRGFAEKTFYGEPYNKTYYPEFFARSGFAVKKTWDSLERSGRFTLENMIARFEPRYQTLVDEHYQFKAVDVSQTDDLQKLHRVLIRSYHGMLGAAAPFEFGDFERLLGQYLRTMEARFVNLVYDPGGNVAGFGVAYPDYSDRLPAPPSDLNQPNISRSRFQRRKTDRAVLYMIGATPEEVARRHGLGSALHYHIMRQILSAGFQTVVFAIIADDSGARGLLGDEMRSVQRTYSLYELNR
jgi:hypothetical protein